MSKWHFSSVYFWPLEPMGQKRMISFCCFELKLKKLSFTVLFETVIRKGHHQPHRLPCFLQNLERHSTPSTWKKALDTVPHGSQGIQLTCCSREKEPSRKPMRKTNAWFVEPLGDFRAFRAPAVLTSLGPPNPSNARQVQNRWHGASLVELGAYREHS